MQDALQHTVARMTSLWRGCPPVHVVRNVAALPFPAPADTEATYRLGEVHLVADTLAPERAARVLAHEVVAHHGLRQHWGSSWRGFMFGVLQGTRTDPYLSGARRHVEAIYSDDAGAPALPAVHLADEVAAAVVERALNPFTGRLEVEQPLQKQAAAAAGHVAREWLFLDRAVDRAQLEGALLAAEHQLRHGGKFFGWRERLGGWYARAMAKKPYDWSKPPMSLRQSESLLAAEKQRIESKGDLRISLGIIALVIALPVGLYFSVMNIATLLRWIFAGHA